MRVRHLILLIPVISFMGCGGMGFDIGNNSQSLRPARKAAVEGDVRQFVSNVAHDVTQDGPLAWRKYFSDSPAFFMAVNGAMAFPSGQAAAQAIPAIAGQYKHIELHWGDDLRVDALTENLCVVAASYTEVSEFQPGVKGPQGTEKGYFTGLAEKRNGQWQFRNAHWSSAVPPPKAS